MGSLMGGLPPDVVTEILRVLETKHGSGAAWSLAATSRSHLLLYRYTHRRFCLPKARRWARLALATHVPMFRALRKLELPACALSPALCGAWQNAWAVLSGVNDLQLQRDCLSQPGAARSLRVILLGCRSLRSFMLAPRSGALRWAIAPCVAKKLEIVDGADFEEPIMAPAACSAVMGMSKRLEELRIDVGRARGSALGRLFTHLAACPFLRVVTLRHVSRCAQYHSAWRPDVRVLLEESGFHRAFKAVQTVGVTNVSLVRVFDDAGRGVDALQDFVRAMQRHLRRVRVVERADWCAVESSNDGEAIGSLPEDCTIAQHVDGFSALQVRRLVAECAPDLETEVSEASFVRRRNAVHFEMQRNA